MLKNNYATRHATRARAQPNTKYKGTNERGAWGRGATTFNKVRPLEAMEGSRGVASIAPPL